VSEFTLWVTLPSGTKELDLLHESTGLAEPLLDLRYGPEKYRKSVVSEAIKESLAGLTIFVDYRDDDLVNFFCDTLPDSSRMILSSSHWNADSIQKSIESIKNRGIAAAIEVQSREEAAAAANFGADFIVVSGNEACGPVSAKTSLILIQEICPETELPIVLRGSLGSKAMAAAAIAGCSGGILDSQLLLLASSPLSGEQKRSLSLSSPSDTLIVGELLGWPHRFFIQGPPDVSRGLSNQEREIFMQDLPLEQKIALFEEALRALDVGFSDNSQLLPVGQGITFAQQFAQGNLGIRDVLAAYHDELEASAERVFPFSPDSSFARAHSVRYPLVQGPMAHISNNPKLAVKVAENGAIPFLALAGLSADQISRLLKRTKKELQGKPFGAGIVAFSPLDAVSGQVEAIMKSRPDLLIISGGSPEPALDLQREGIEVFIHTPSLGHIKECLGKGVNGIVMEGHEAGGHVGSLGSLILWEIGINEVLSRSTESVESLQILFAGGIGSAHGSLAAGILASSLAEKGISVGLQMGTVYLLTEEAVNSNAISKEFAQILRGGKNTSIVGSSVNLPARWMITPAFGEMIANERSWESKGIKLQERKRRFEKLNRIFTRNALSKVTENTVEAKKTKAYMCGQIVAFQEQMRSMSDLHTELTEAAQQLSRNFTPPIHEETLPSDTIAIVGMGCVFPGAKNLEEYWQNILNRVSSIAEVPKERWDSDLYYHHEKGAPDKSYSKIGAFIRDFKKDPLKFRIPPVSESYIDRGQFLALEAAHQALEDAGCLENDFPRERTAVFVGHSGGAELRLDYFLRSNWARFAKTLESTEGFKTLPNELTRSILENAEKNFKRNIPEFSEDSCGGTFNSIVSGRILNCFDLGGSGYIVDGACAASLAAIENAASGLRERRFDMALAGGVEIRIDPSIYMLFSSLGAISAKGSFPFDERADGFVLGEGAGIIVLKRLGDAIANNDKIYAVIRGIGASSDGRVKGITAPDVRGQVRAMERAYENVPFPPDSISLIEAHGTGTRVGDLAEMTSLTGFMKRYSNKNRIIGIGSVKSMIGHLRAAAGIAGVIKAALAIHYQTLPPTINCDHPRKEIDWEKTPFYLLKEAAPWQRRSYPRRAAVDSFGFGGINFHAILEEPPKLNRARPPITRHIESATKGSPTEGAEPFIEDALKDQDRESVQRYLNQRKQYLREVIRLDYQHHRTRQKEETGEQAPEDVQDDLETRVVRLVSQKSGYPADMIDIDFDVEAELGLDSIKQVEIVHALAQEFQVDLGMDPRQRKGGVFTIRSLIEQIRSLTNKKAEKKTPPEEQFTHDTLEGPWNTENHRWVCDAVERPLQIKKKRFSLKTKRVLLLIEDQGLGDQLKDALEDKGATVSLLQGHGNVGNNLDRLINESDLILNLWAFRDDDKPSLDLCDDWWEKTASSARNLLKICQQLAQLFRENKQKTVRWVELTSLGGSLGAGVIEKVSSKSGIGLGLSRALFQEYPDNFKIRYVDFNVHDPDLEIVESVLNELEYSEAHNYETGYSRGKRSEIRWRIDDNPITEKREHLSAQSIIIAVGGARGITASICRDLAKSAPAKFIVIGKSPAPAGDESLQAITFEEAREKLLSEARYHGRQVVPAEIDQLAWAKVWHAERALNLERLRKLAGEVIYRQCDITNEDEIKRLFDELKKEHNRFDLVIQGAAALVEKSIEDFDIEEFLEGMKPKALGTACILAALEGTRIGTFINLASTGGRWAAKGQGSYAAGHEIASILTSGMRKKNKGRWINIFYGAWLNRGMTRRRETLERLREKGSSFVTESAGSEFFFNEFQHGLNYNVAFCGNNPLRVYQRLTRSGFMDRIDLIAADTAEGRRIFDPSRDTLVSDHYIELDAPILPGVVSLEMMAQTASVLVDPEYSLTDIEDVSFIKAGRFPNGEPQEFLVRARLTDKHHDSMLLKCEVYSLTAQSGNPAPEEAILSTCRMHFGVRKPPQKPSLAVPLTGFTDNRIDAESLWETNNFSNRRGVFRTIRSISSVTPNSAVGEVQASQVPEFGSCPYLDNPIRIDGFALLPRLSAAMFRGLSLFYLVGIESISFYQSDSPADKRLCRAKISELTTDEVSCDIEALGQDGLVRERLRGIRKVAAQQDRLDIESDLILASLRESLFHTDIKQILGWKSNLSLTHISIPTVENALLHDEDALISEQLSPEEIEEYKALSHHKRRIEWLAGRIAVKAAIQGCFTSDIPVPSDIIVRRDSDNSMFTHRLGREKGNPSLHLSISHSHEVAVAASVQDALIGVDVEKISEQIEEIGDRFAKPDEVKRFVTNVQTSRAAILTCIWAIKEATCKALGPNSMKDLILLESESVGEYTLCRIRQSGGDNIDCITFTAKSFAYALCLIPRNDVATEAVASRIGTGRRTAARYRWIRSLFNTLMIPVMKSNPPLAFRLSYKLGCLLYRLKIFKPSLGEVRQLIGDRTGSERRAIGKQITARTFMNSLLYNFFRRSGLEAMLPYVTCQNTEQILTYLSEEKPVIFVHCHYGPLIGLSVGMLKLNISLALLTSQNSGTPLPEKLVRFHILDSVESRASVLHRAIKHLNSRGNILVAIDGGGSNSHPVRLLDHNVPFMRGAAMLSRLTGAKLVPVFTKWIPERGRILFRALPSIDLVREEYQSETEYENVLLKEAAHRFGEVMTEAPEDFSLTQLRRLFKNLIN